MRVVIRTDSSLKIGTGHLMRCLTLAKRLSKRGVEVLFVCRDLPGNIASQVKEAGCGLTLLPFRRRDCPEDGERLNYLRWLGTNLPQDATDTIVALPPGQKIDWLVVDHYAIDINWEKRLRRYVDRIMVIDDLADRQHDCDLLLDQNLNKNIEDRYDKLVPLPCRKLLGVKYSLLRDEFLQAPYNLSKLSRKIKRLLIYFGGVDRSNETVKSLKAVRQLSRADLQVDIIVGEAYQYREELDLLAVDMRGVTIRGPVNNIATFMARADLAIGGGGTTTWERCFMGLPSLVIILAENQEAMIEAADERGVLWNIGWFHQVTADDIAASLNWLLDNPDLVHDVASQARSLFENPPGESGDVTDYMITKEAVSVR